MQSSITLFLLVLSSLTFAIGPGFLTQKKRDWSFIQSVGGMTVASHEQSLIINCDVSGTRKVTVKPTLINSGIGVRKIIHKRDGNKIQLTLVTSVIGKDTKTNPKPLNLSRYPAGTYQVVYLDGDGKEHDLGSVKLTSPPEVPIIPAK
jgi:hypothetical protein